MILINELSFNQLTNSLFLMNGKIANINYLINGLINVCQLILIMLLVLIKRYYLINWYWLFIKYYLIK